jgi:hypothetical protein
MITSSSPLRTRTGTLLRVADFKAARQQWFRWFTCSETHQKPLRPSVTSRSGRTDPSHSGARA